MTRQRTKYNYTHEEYQHLYQGYDITKWHDHIYRVAISSIILQEFVKKNRVLSLADLSAGDGMVTRDVPVKKYLGDFSIENCIKGGFEYCGYIEDNLLKIPFVDLYVCSETLEHVGDPDLVLSLIALKARSLFLTTPLDEAPDINPEHLWVWGQDDIEEMLGRAGFVNYEMYLELNFGVSRFQVWLATQ